MTRVPVVSSLLKSVGYNEAEKNLQVEFKSGDIYTYHDVPLKKVQALWKATSMGKAFNALIKSHKFTKHDD